MFGKTQIKLILLMSVISIVVSCLVTNCPRGGKRGESNFYLNYLSDGRKCKICDPDEEICSEGICSSDNCDDYGRCVSPEVCCAKRFCKLEMSCRGNFKLTKENKSKPSSIILTKILTYNFSGGKGQRDDASKDPEDIEGCGGEKDALVEVLKDEEDKFAKNWRNEFPNHEPHGRAKSRKREHSFRLG